jgi:hypothetical protein
MWTGNLDPVSNRETWQETVSYRPADGTAAPALDEVVVTIAGGCAPRSSKLSDGGVTVDRDAGTFTFVFDASDMRRLRPGAYRLGIVLTINNVPVQLFAGSIEIIDGIVPCS